METSDGTRSLRTEPRGPLASAGPPASNRALRGRPLPAGDRLDVARDLLRVLLVEQLRGHLTLPPRAAMLDGVGSQPRGRRQLVEVGADATDGAGVLERVARCAPRVEELAPLLELGAELVATRSRRGLVAAQHDDGHGDAEERDDAGDGELRRVERLAAPALERVAHPARTAAHRDEDDTEAKNDEEPKEDRCCHAARNLLHDVVGR